MGAAIPVIPTTHERPAEGEAHELLGFEQVLFWLRLIGVAVMVSQAPAYELLDPLIIGAVAVLTCATAVAQRLTLRPDVALDVLRRRARAFLVSDVVAVYVMGTAFVPDPAWLAFYFYPLLSLEATLIGGTLAGFTVTGLSILVYAAQLSLHVLLGNVADGREIVGAVSMIAMTGGFIAVFGLLAERGRRDLRVMLGLTSALARRRNELETIRLLDDRLHEAVGGRVRSIAIRGEDGRFRVFRWRDEASRPIGTPEVGAGLGELERLSATFAAGAAVTYQADAWSAIATTLALPAWAEAATLVPIFLEGGWVGILPVLWPTPRVPTRHELRLLYGLAGHVGLALAQDQLQRVRAEAAMDPLTRLLNRRAISDELTAYVARAARAGDPMAVLFCDLDGFKAVNDRHGHTAGDAILQDVASAVRGALRQGDVAGRYGGDELLVVAADANADDAVALARRTRAAVRAVAPDESVDLTIGIAVYPADGTTDAELMVAADQAMYRGKLRGTGQIVVAGEDEPRPELLAG